MGDKKLTYQPDWRHLVYYESISARRIRVLGFLDRTPDPNYFAYVTDALSYETDKSIVEILFRARLHHEESPLRRKGLRSKETFDHDSVLSTYEESLRAAASPKVRNALHSALASIVSRDADSARALEETCWILERRLDQCADSQEFLHILDVLETLGRSDAERLIRLFERNVYKEGLFAAAPPEVRNALHSALASIASKDADGARAEKACTILKGCPCGKHA